MQTPRLLVALIVASAGLSAVRAQLTPADQEKMLEALRQKVAEERAQTSPTPGVLGSGTAKPSAPAPLAEKKAVARERAAEAPHPAAPAKASASSKSKPAVKETPAVRTPPPQQQTAPIQPSPEQSTGPKTKQERLEALLLLYKADKISPPEYHEQRAKILTEP